MDIKQTINVALRDGHINDVAEVARIGVDTWRSTYRGIVPDHTLASLSYERSTENWKRQILQPAANQVFLVATQADDQVIGYAIGGTERENIDQFDCEVYALYVDARFHKNGVGRSLVEGCAAQFIAANFTAMLIWVLRDNQMGRRFYEAMGGIPVAEKSINIGGKNLTETAYGWHDLSQFLA